MTWSKTFEGTKHEVITKINEELPREAHPEHAIRQFVGAQLPDNPEPNREFSVTCSGGVSTSKGYRSANLYVAVTEGQLRAETPSEAEGVNEGQNEGPGSSEPAVAA